MTLQEQARVIGEKLGDDVAKVLTLGTVGFLLHRLALACEDRATHLVDGPEAVQLRRVARIFFGLSDAITFGERA